MVYPLNSAKTTGATISMSEIRDMYTSYTSTFSVSNIGSKTVYFDISSVVGHPVYATFTQTYYALGAFRNCAPGAWMTYSIGSSTVSAGQIGLPFSNPQDGETIYGLSNYGYGGGGMTFGSISSPNGFVYPGNIYNRLRQAIYRPYDNQFYFRLSDYNSTFTPSSSAMSNGVWYYRDGPNSASTTLIIPSDAGADNTFEPTRIYSTVIPPAGHNTSGIATVMFNV